MAQQPSMLELHPKPISARIGELFVEARELLESDAARAEQLAREACALANHLGDPSDLAEALLLWGLAAYRQAKLEEASHHLHQAIEHSPPAIEQEACTTLGQVCRDLGEIALAKTHWARALDLARLSNDRMAEAKILNLMASAFHAEGDYLGALGLLQQALVLQKQLGNLKGQANCLSNLGILYTRLDDYPKALEHLLEAYTLARDEMRDARSEVQHLINIGNLYVETKECLRAKEYFTQALQSSQHHDLKLYQAMTTINLASVELSLGQHPLALELFEQGYERAKAVGFRVGEIAALSGQGQTQAVLQDHPQALTCYDNALQIAQEIGNHEQALEILLNIGQVHLSNCAPNLALERLEPALAQALESGRKKLAYQAHELIAKAHQHLGNFEQALSHYQSFHQGERELFNQETERQTRNLGLKFELEKVRSEELEKTQLEVVQRLAKAADYRDDDTGEHAKRVGDNAAKIAKAMGWPNEQAELLRQAAPMHDIGKIGVPDAILLKPGKYTPTEYELMKAHAAIGAELLSGGRSKLLQMAEQIALSHHERWDGSGYPNKLVGEQIPEAGRIVAVADVLDALTNERPYKSAWPLSKALEEIHWQSGKHFDPKVVEACLKVFEGEGRGQG